MNSFTRTLMAAKLDRMQMRRVSEAIAGMGNGAVGTIGDERGGSDDRRDWRFPTYGSGLRRSHDTTNSGAGIDERRLGLLGEFEEYITDYFGYDKVLPMNSGAEGDVFID